MNSEKSKHKKELPSDQPAEAAPKLEQPQPAIYRRQDDSFVYQNPDNQDDHAQWAVPWSDLMMTMFILFAVLFVYASSNRDFFREISMTLQESNANQESGSQNAKGIDPYSSPGNVIDFGAQTSYELNNIGINEKELRSITEKVEQSNSVRFNLNGAVLFAPFSDEILPQAANILTKLGKIIKKSNLQIHIIGHTESFPVHNKRFPSNWDLSLARAINVAKFMMYNLGIEPQRFLISGRGMYSPILPNTSNENRKFNRRVEIILFREQNSLYQLP